MKKIAAIALAGILAFMNAACMKTVPGPNPPSPSPNVGVVVALETAAASCTVTSVLITGPVSALLAGPCKTAMLDILNIVEANGSSAKITAAIQTLQDAVNALPPGTPYVNYAQAAIGLAQVALNTYIAVTQGTPVVAGGTSKAAGVSASRPIVWTASETARIDAARLQVTR